MSQPRHGACRIPFAKHCFVLAAVILALASAPASGSVVISTGANFQVAINAAENVDVSCVGGIVTVTVNAVPTASGTLCSAVTNLDVTASGTFNNTLNQSAVGSVDFTAIPTVTINGGGGDDGITGTGLADTINGGDGNDTISALGGADTIDGGNGNDTIIGGTGADIVLPSAGDDGFTWNPGDGSDLFDGGSGTDTLNFFGSAGAEIFTINAVGSRVELLRNVGAIDMDLGTVEQINLDALGGIDSATVNNLTGVADLTGISLLMGDANDTVDASLQVNTAILLTINGGAGDDTLTGSAAVDTFFGGTENDTISGLGGADSIDGGDGNDSILGGTGADTVNGTLGDDVFTWNPGDGSDIFDGGTGIDTLVFNGSAGAEIFTITGNPGGFTLTRNVGAITMTITAVENLNLIALGGDDQVNTVGLPGTTQNLDGGTQGTADVLNVDPQNAPVTSSPGIILIAGSQPINHSNFETVNILASIPALNNIALAALAMLMALMGMVAIRSRS